MGKRAKDSGAAAPKAKGAKKGGSELPPIPPDAVKLPHLVKFNDWAQLSYDTVLQLYITRVTKDTKDHQLVQYFDRFLIHHYLGRITWLMQRQPWMHS